MKGTSLKWIDHRALAKILLRGHRIDKVKYFTSRVQGRHDNPGLSQRQDDYIRALTAHSEVEVHFGQFKRRKKRLPLVKDLSEFVQVVQFEEKQTSHSVPIWFGMHAIA